MERKQTEDMWELTIVDGDPPGDRLQALTVADIDGDGKDEIVTGGHDVLLWYKPQTRDRGLIAEGRISCDVTTDDVDGDGALEVITGVLADDGWQIVWFKPAKDITRPWTAHVLGEKIPGHPHDVIVTDIDSDGINEIVINLQYKTCPAIYIYKPGDDRTELWTKHTVQEGLFCEGTDIADVFGDGKLEICAGPYVFRAPDGGPFSAPWIKTTYAPGFREMNRVRAVDVTGNGKPDLVIAESEYLDGRMSWFENCTDQGEPSWIEHKLERDLYYAHSLAARRDEKTGEVRIFVAEMAEGGWKAPRNYDARLMEYVSTDNGKTWKREMISGGTGTHQAIPHDIDADGELEIVGKQWIRRTVQIWKKPKKPSPFTRFAHVMIDRDKPHLATDIIPVDIDGDGNQDVVCGPWWYHNPTWERRTIPGIYQVINAYDIDGDGRTELIATKKRPNPKNPYHGLTSELVWVKPIDPLSDRWEQHEIGTGTGDWPHGSCIAPLLPGGRLGLVTAYHSGQREDHYPEIFEAPDDPTASPWNKRILAEIQYGEQLVPCDITGSGELDIAAGEWWLENLSDGTFKPHRIAEGFKAARIAVADITGDGKVDFILGEEVLDFENKVTPPSRLVWLENPGDPREKWIPHAIDILRCPHSVAAADLDGDGQIEIVCGEHDPFYPYRTRCRLLVYKKADPRGLTWKRFVLDDRFEHHDGAQLIDLGGGRTGIISHGWKDERYVHLWVPQ